MMGNHSPSLFGLLGKEDSINLSTEVTEGPVQSELILSLSQANESPGREDKSLVQTTDVFSLENVTGWGLDDHELIS